MRAQWVCSRERRIALYKRSSINQKPTTTGCPTSTVINLSLEYCLLITDTKASLTVCITATEFLSHVPRFPTLTVLFGPPRRPGSPKPPTLENGCKADIVCRICIIIFATHLGQGTAQRKTYFSHCRYSESSTRRVGPVWLLLQYVYGNAVYEPKPSGQSGALKRLFLAPQEHR